MKELLSNVNGHLTHFSICYKIEIRSKWKKIDGIHILSRTKGKNEKLIYSVFLAKRTDELSFLSSRTHSWRGFPTLGPLLLATPSLFQILSYPNPFLFLFACLHDWSCDRLICFNQVYDDFLVVRVFQIALTLFRMGLFGAAHGLTGRGGGAKRAPSPLNLSHISYNHETWHTYVLPK